MNPYVDINNNKPGTLKINKKLKSRVTLKITMLKSRVTNKKSGHFENNNNIKNLSQIKMSGHSE